MDVLRPALININGRLYRRNIIKEEHYEEEEEEEDLSYMGPPGNFSPVCVFVLSRSRRKNKHTKRKK